MLSYALRRLAMIVPVLLGISVIVFLVMAMIPGRPGARHPREASRRRRTPRSSARSSASTGP